MEMPTASAVLKGLQSVPRPSSGSTEAVGLDTDVCMVAEVEDSRVPFRLRSCSRFDVTLVSIPAERLRRGHPPSFEHAFSLQHPTKDGSVYTHVYKNFAESSDDAMSQSREEIPS